MENYEEETRRFSYDVFLSFRVEDTRNTFIEILRKELRRKEIHIFTDDNDDDLALRQDISDATSKAIEESKISIIVLSENYASSTRCLDELVKILNCKNSNNKQLVIPIFYHVDPSYIRHQKNSYGEAITAHEKMFEEEKVQTWKSALSEIASLKGLHITPGSEIKSVENIVKAVYVEIPPKPLPIGQNPVGLEHRIEEVKSLLDKKPSPTVCMLGIYGLGGVGKTELAKALYNKIVHQFDAASFLEIVTELKNSKDLEDLQKKLLSDMRQELETELGNTSKGIYEIKRKLDKKKVLLVLDGVDDKEQLSNLAGECDWFGPGSRIIITTRDKDLLIDHQVDEVYKMTELNDQHSLELFCQKAFGKSHPEIGYEDMSSRVVGYAKGLPLALRVIGSDLGSKKNLEALECALKEYKRIPNKEIQDVLKISYDRLEDHAKHVFLDIACFFIGERIEYVEKILEEFGATYNIKVLVNKCLLTVEHGYLKMHDLIQDMGREIVRQENLDQHGKRSRLWFYEDVLEVLTKDSGSDAIQGIMLDPPQREVLDWSGTAFEKMKYLRILIIRNTAFSSEPRHLPNHLRLLDWEKYPSESFPPKFHPKKIITFNLSQSDLKLEEPFKKISLRTLYFGNSGLSDEDLRAILNYFPKLEELIASENNFESLHECIKEFIHLTSLDVSVCQKLQEIPKCTNLRILDVHQCEKLEHISELSSTIQKVDARYCFSLSRETLNMLWYQVTKEIRGLEIVIPENKILELFSRGNGENPHLWARRKFPVVALALVFDDVNEMARQSHEQLVELQLVINGLSVPHKGYYNSRIAPNHALVFDLRLLFSNEEWLGLDAFLEHEWNLVQVSYESTMTLSCWGFFVYEQGTIMEDIEFMCPSSA